MTNKLIANYISETGFKTILKNKKYNKFFSSFANSKYGIIINRQHKDLTENDINILKHFKKINGKIRQGQDVNLWHKNIYSACLRYKKKDHINFINPKKINKKIINDSLFNIVYCEKIENLLNLKFRTKSE